MSHAWAFSAVLAAVSLAGCMDEANLSVTVRQWDPSTGQAPQPVAGATVDVQQRIATTDEAGMAYFRDVQVRYSDVFVDFVWEGQPVHLEDGMVMEPGENVLTFTWPEQTTAPG